MILRITKNDGWDLGRGTSELLIEIDSSGRILRLIDLDQHGNIVDASPTRKNPHGAIDHPPLEMNADWAANAFPVETFEMLWGRTQK